MRTLLFIVVLAMCATAVFAHDKPNPPMPTVKEDPIVVTDTWNGKDKRDHLVISAVLGAGARAFVTAQPIAAGGLCLVPGVLKEAYDSRPGGPGNWSWKDMGANLVGCALGVAGTDLVLTKDGNRYTVGYNWRF